MVVIFINFKADLVIDILNISCTKYFECIEQNLSDEESTLFQVMAWWLQATRHDLN